MSMSEEAFQMRGPADSFLISEVLIQWSVSMAAMLSVVCLALELR